LRHAREIILKAISEVPIGGNKWVKRLIQIGGESLSVNDMFLSLRAIVYGAKRSAGPIVVSVQSGALKRKRKNRAKIASENTSRKPLMVIDVDAQDADSRSNIDDVPTTQPQSGLDASSGIEVASRQEDVDEKIRKMIISLREQVFFKLC